MTRPSPAVLALMACLTAGAVGAAIWLAGHAQDCQNRWRESGLKSYYRDGACFVQAGSRWVPETAVKVHVVSETKPRVKP